MDIEFFEQIVDLLLHPETEFQKQGLMLLESLSDEKLWAQLMKGVRFSPRLEHFEYGLSSGMVTALLKNPFYDYSEVTELSITGRLPFDLENIGLENLEKLTIYFGDFHPYRKHIASKNPEQEPELFFFQGLKDLSSLTYLEIGLQGASQYLFPEEFIENMVNITQLHIRSIQKRRGVIDLDFVEHLPNLGELHLIEMDLGSKPPPQHPVQIYFKQEINSEIQKNSWQSIHPSFKLDRKAERYTFFSYINRYGVNRIKHLDLKYLARLNTKEILLDFEEEMILKNVFSLLQVDDFPLLRTVKNCFWGFEFLMTAKELFSNPDQVKEKLLSAKEKLEERGFVVIPIDPSGFRFFWDKTKRYFVLDELQYLNIDELYLQLENPKALSLSTIDVEGFSSSIRKIVIASGIWSEESWSWNYAGHSASMLSNFSGLRKFPDLEEIELHNFHRVKHKTFVKYFSKIPKLRTIRLVRCKVSKKSFEQVMRKYLPKVKLIVDNTA